MTGQAKEGAHDVLHCSSGVSIGIRLGQSRENAHTAHEPEVECKHAMVLGEDAWGDEDIQRVRGLIVHIEKVQSPV